MAWPRALHLACVAMMGLLAACASAPTSPAAVLPAHADAETVFILVPHAETAEDDPDDPALSPTGRARAQALARQLRDVPLEAVYADEFRRTQQTVMPTLQARGDLKLSRYFSRGPLDQTARQWRQQHRGQVLVAGEPEAIAPLANALCNCTVRPLQAGETDRLIRITAVAGSPVRVEDRRYGAPP